MKKSITKKMSLLLVLMLVAALACGCGKETETTTAASVESSVQEVAPESSSIEESVAESSEEESSEEASVEESSSEEVVESETSYEKIGEGANAFTFEMTLGDETVGYEINTDETTVGAALLGLDLIGGEESQYGLFVTTVMGNDPTSEADGTPYWAFYIDGAYAPTGVDSTDVVPGATYSFVVETY